LLSKSSIAQQAWNNVVMLCGGSYTAAIQTSVPTNASTLILPANAKRASAACMNNSAFVIWIGTNAAGSTLGSVGFPVTSSQTVTVDGFSDAVYAVATGGTADVRCWDGQIR